MDLFADAVEAGTLDSNPYAPPPLVRRSMAGVRETPYNGLHFIGSFSGCGGSSLGLRLAGWHPLAAVEFVAAAASTYRANFPSTRVYEADIRSLEASRLLEELDLRRGELDLFEGSPPCASFSMAGSREKAWGEVKKYSDTKQSTDDLFWEWKRILEGLEPRAFLAENVPGMAMGKALEEYGWKITSDLSKLGYRVSATVLNSAHFGVPQSRKRLIFIGFREDTGVEPGDVVARIKARAVVAPNTVRQALESVDSGDPDHADFLEDSWIEGSAIGRALEVRRGTLEVGDCATCGGRVTEYHGERDGKRVCPDGREAVEVKDYFMLSIPELDEPCPTLTATAAQRFSASVIHPTEARKFTPAEAKALSGFPADFELTGSREERIERLGRTVTPPLYEVVGGEIARVLRRDGK